MTARKNVNVTKGKQGFQETARVEASPIDLEDLREKADAAQATYCRALEHRLATEIAEEHPEVAFLEFDSREHPDEVVPWLRDALDENEQPVDEEVLDAIRNDFLSGYNEREFGDWVEGNSVNLTPSRHPAYVHGGAEEALEAQAVDTAVRAIYANCKESGWGSLADMLERLHVRGQVDATDSATLDTDALYTLGERHFAPLVDRVCDEIGEGVQIDADDCVSKSEWDRFKERSGVDLGATTTTLEAIETALDREEIAAGALDKMDRATVDMLETYTEDALDRLAAEVNSIVGQ